MHKFNKHYLKWFNRKVCKRPKFCRSLIRNHSDNQMLRPGQRTRCLTSALSADGHSDRKTGSAEGVQPNESDWCEFKF